MIDIKFRTIADVEAVERQPLSALGLPASVYHGIEANAARHGNRVASYGLTTGSADEQPRAFTFAETFRAITQTANLLHSLGIGPEDTVTLLMPVVPEAAACLWAAETAGIANPVNPFLEIDYLEAIMRAAKTKVLVAWQPSIDPLSWPKVEELRQRLPELATLQVGSEAFERALAEQPDDRLAFARDFAATDVAAYFHTGGTTGLPKLAKHTHLGQLLQCRMLHEAMRPHPEQPLSLLGLPLFHVGGAMVGSLMSLLHGTTQVYLHPNGFRDAVAIRDAWRNAARFKVTSMLGVPAVWSALLTLPTDGIDLSSLECGLVGGSSLSVEVAEAVMKKLGIPLYEGWGMTEVHSLATFNPPAGEMRVGSIGLRFPHTHLRIAQLDETGAFVRGCDTDEIGVVLARGPGVMAGYVDPEHDVGAWVECGDGAPWLNTGDLGRMDAEHYIWLTGRAKDLIIRGGHNIDPALMENVLYSHPDVELAAAVGQPDRRVGEIPVAYVKMKDGAAFDEAALKAFVGERVQERAATPVWIAALDQMPLTTVGKIFKPALRNDAAERIFRAELTSLAGPGETVEVAVAPDRRHGALAQITVSAPDPGAAERLKQQCHEAMAGYPMRFEILVA